MRNISKELHDKVLDLIVKTNSLYEACRKAEDLGITSISTFRRIALDIFSDIEAINDYRKNYSNRYEVEMESKKVEVSEIKTSSQTDDLKNICKVNEEEVSNFTKLMMSTFNDNKPLKRVEEVFSKKFENKDCVPENFNNNNYKTMVIISDTHDLKSDDFTIKMFFETLKQVKPDIVVLNGDIGDFNEFSKFFKDLRNFNVLESFRWIKNFCKKIRETLPNAYIVYNAGNHEERVPHYLLNQAPSMIPVLVDFLEMKGSDFFGLKDLNIEFVSKADLSKVKNKNDLNKEIAKNYKIFDDTFLVGHMPNLKNLGVPGCNGHLHSYSVESLHNHTYGSYFWTQTGCAHINEADYCDAEKWNTGFLINRYNKKDKKNIQEYIDTTNGVAVLNNKIYTKDSFK